eukprot:3074686-Pleurochrysis_carterae.AAC.1
MGRRTSAGVCMVLSDFTVLYPLHQSEPFQRGRCKRAIRSVTQLSVCRRSTAIACVVLAYSAKVCCVHSVGCPAWVSGLGRHTTVHARSVPAYIFVSYPPHQSCSRQHCNYNSTARSGIQLGLRRGFSAVACLILANAAVFYPPLGVCSFQLGSYCLAAQFVVRLSSRRHVSTKACVGMAYVPVLCCLR